MSAKITGMKKSTSGLAAAVLSASLIVAPAANAADADGGKNGNALQDAFSSASSNAEGSSGVTRDKDNADKIPDGYKVPDKNTLEGAYLGFAPLSIFLAVAIPLGLIGAALNYPPVKTEVNKFLKQYGVKLPF